MGNGKFGSILLGLVARGVKRVIACTPATKASAGCHRVSCMLCMSRSSTVNAAQGAWCSGSTGHDYSEQIWSALNHWIEWLWGIGYDATKVFLMRRARLPDEILIVYLVYCGLWRVVLNLVGCRTTSRSAPHSTVSLQLQSRTPQFDLQRGETSEHILFADMMGTFIEHMIHCYSIALDVPFHTTCDLRFAIQSFTIILFPAKSGL